MEIVYSEQAIEDLAYWKKNGNRIVIAKITALLRDIAEHPQSGIGKPEALKYSLSGRWSRRINSEHRIIYSIDDNLHEVHILAARYHYNN